MVYRVQILVILLLILIFTNANSAIYHVHLEGNDENDGLTWSDAFATLQAALTASVMKYGLPKGHTIPLLIMAWKWDHAAGTFVLNPE